MILIIIKACLIGLLPSILLIVFLGVGKYRREYNAWTKIDGEWRCSYCGGEPCYLHINGASGYALTPYCPWCGRKLK